MGTEPFLGKIAMFGFNFPPKGFAQCNGQSMNISQNSALFALLGTYYGGNGQTTFNLPDLRSRVPIHMGQGPGLSPYVIGQQAGTEAVTLVTSQLPSHTHVFTSTSTLKAVNSRSTSQAPADGSMLARAVDGGGTSSPEIYVPAGTAGTQATLGGLNVAGTNSIVGSNLPVGIVQPYLAVNFCIALQGVYPSRN